MRFFAYLRGLWKYVMRKTAILIFCLWTSVSVFSYTDLNYYNPDSPITDYVYRLLQNSDLLPIKIVLTDY